VTKFFMNSVVTAVAFVALSAATPAFGQRGYKPPAGPTPKLPNGKPDFSGLWQRPYTPDMTKDSPRPGPDSPTQKGMAELPFTDWGLSQWKSYDAANGDYTGQCLPFGLVRSINSPDPVQIMQNDQFFSLLHEQNSWFHVVRLNAQHPKDPMPTWFGDSVGNWEGDTLVIDTIGFNGRTRLDTIGHPHSDQMHVVERWQRPDLGHINYEITIDDPKTYTKAWKNTRTFILRTDWQIMEYSCEENNKDVLEGHIKGVK
jgi:hypothetical protein